MKRELLPGRRRSENFEVRWGNIALSVSVGYYDDGRPGEVFIDTDRKRGSSIDIAARDIGLLLSLALQHGCMPSAIASSVTGDSMAGMVVAELARQQA